MAGDKYAALRAEFMRDKTATLADLARKHGVPYGSLRTIAARQKWSEARSEAEQKLTDAAQKSTEEAVSKAAREVADDAALTYKRNMTLLKYVQQNVGETLSAQRQKGVPFTPQENKANAGAVLELIRGRNLLCGEPTESLELSGALTLAQVDRAQLAELMREVLQE